MALFTIVLSNFLQSAQWLDPVGGLVISGMIVQAGWTNTKSALFELADVGMDDEVRQNAETVAKAVVNTGDAKVRGVQGIKSGQNLMFDVEIGVPQDWSVFHCSEVEAEVREAIAQKVRGTKRVNVRFTAGESDQAAFADQFTSKDASEIADEPVEHNHGHDGHDGHDHDHDQKHDNGHATGANANGTTHKRK